MNPTIIVYGLMALALMGSIGTGFHYVKKWGGDEVRAEWNEAITTQREEEIQRSLVAAQGLSADRSKARVNTQKRSKTVETIIVTNTVYRNTCLDASGLRCLESAILGKDADGCKPDGAVPGAVTPQ